jgi:hypothetical protein
MSYYSDLAQNLRKRGCEEDQVLTVLHEVKDTAEAAGTRPEAEFGKPEDKASEYSGRRTRSRGRTVLNVFGFVGVCCVALHAIWPGQFGFMNPAITLLTLLIIGALVAGFIDTRVPKEFED